MLSFFNVAKRCPCGPEHIFFFHPSVLSLRAPSFPIAGVTGFYCVDESLLMRWAVLVTDAVAVPSEQRLALTDSILARALLVDRRNGVESSEQIDAQRVLTKDRRAPVSRLSRLGKVKVGDGNTSNEAPSLR